MGPEANATRELLKDGKGRLSHSVAILDEEGFLETWPLTVIERVRLA